MGFQPSPDHKAGLVHNGPPGSGKGRLTINHAFASLQPRAFLRKFLGFPGGMLKDSDDLMAKVWTFMNQSLEFSGVEGSFFVVG